jgi:Ca2+-binding RTX toxin-like protein
MSKTALRRYLTAGAVLTATAIAGLVAVPAFAASFGIVKDTSTGIEFTAGAGVVNKMDVWGTKDPVLYFEDLNRNPIRLDPSAEARCDLVTRYAVRCKDTTPFTATFNLGDLNDSYLNSNGYVPTTVRGGSGNDVLNAKLAIDPVKLFGEAGNDRLIGGDGNDILNTGPAAGNVVQTADGGKGKDACTGQQTATFNCEPVIQN